MLGTERKELKKKKLIYLSHDDGLKRYDLECYNLRYNLFDIYDLLFLISVIIIIVISAN